MLIARRHFAPSLGRHSGAQGRHGPNTGGERPASMAGTAPA